jgi:acetoin utilization deacetylase AcuC-like enzyme
MESIRSNVICYLGIIRFQIIIKSIYIDGSCIALEKGYAINLSGGYHHAGFSRGGGFCIYPDI